MHRLKTQYGLLVMLLQLSAPGLTFAADEADLTALRSKLESQQRQIEELQAAVQEQAKLLQRLTAQSPAAEPKALGASAQPAAQAVSVQQLSKQVEADSRNIAGFRFSGDFRFRLDVQARSSNEFAGPLQNIRSRYRVRVNVDKELDPRFRFHMQLSTGPYNVGITNDQDYGGTVAKHPFSIAEAYVDYHPNSIISLRTGRMEEIFADNTRFLWDDDVRFNGFQQIVKLPVNVPGIKTIEFRSGEYILSNPNVPVLAPTSPFVTAGYQPGQKIRAANLFHPGFVIRGDLAPSWSHQVFSGFEIYRNANQIQLASTAAGFPVLVSNALGLVLAGPMTGTGNATTAAGGAVLNARNFQIVHAGYRLERKGIKLGAREMPGWLDFQVSRNVGTGKLRDAFMASANLGTIQKTGDVRFLYQFAIKDANSMISQFTDDDLGTGTGVNIAVHALRFDLGITRFLQWQNLLFIQNERRANNPQENFFVPLQRGANPTLRFLGQLAFSF